MNSCNCYKIASRIIRYVLIVSYCVTLIYFFEGRMYPEFAHVSPYMIMYPLYFYPIFVYWCIGNVSMAFFVIPLILFQIPLVATIFFNKSKLGYRVCVYVFLGASLLMSIALMIATKNIVYLLSSIVWFVLAILVDVFDSPKKLNSNHDSN